MTLIQSCERLLTYGDAARLPTTPSRPEPLGLDEHRLAVLLDVLRIAQRPDRRQQRAQRLLALGERQRAQVETVEGEQIERVERARQLERRTLGVRAAREAAALLEQREARDAARVVDDHLAVDDEARR